MLRFTPLIVLLVGCASSAGGAASLPPLRMSHEGCNWSIVHVAVQEQAAMLKCGGTSFRVLHPKNLYGLVTIDNASDALTFVRFFSSRRTYFLFDVRGFVEIGSGIDRERQDFFLIPAQAFNESFAKPDVTSHDGGVEGKVFTIKRYVVAVDQKIYLLTERVTERGNYDIVSAIVVANDAARLGILHLGDH